jgi:hypothetical protein
VRRNTLFCFVRSAVPGIYVAALAKTLPLWAGGRVLKRIVTTYAFSVDNAFLFFYNGRN